MKEAPPRWRPHVGMRNLKTALAATLCALLYLPFGRNPTFACIGAIFGVGNDLGHSWLNGGNRLFGTVIGGFLGMGLFRIYISVYPEGGTHLLLFVLLFAGVVLTILASQLFRWPGAVQPGGVVLCIILFNTPVDTYVSYSLNRMLDTGIGVVVALLVNVLLPRERVYRWLDILFPRRRWRRNTDAAGGEVLLGDAPVGEAAPETACGEEAWKEEPETVPGEEAWEEGPEERDSPAALGETAPEAAPEGDTWEEAPDGEAFSGGALEGTFHGAAAEEPAPEGILGGGR